MELAGEAEVSEFELHSTELYASTVTSLAKSCCQKELHCNIFLNRMCLFLLAIYRKLDICECRTRKAFMEETFPQIRHVILDEVHNFQAEDGDWLSKARALVKQQIIERELSHYDFAFDTESFLESQSETEQDNSDTNFVAERYPECSNDDLVSDNESVLAFFGEFETELDNSDTNCVAGLRPECSICQNDGPGYLWCFMDRGQGIHKLKKTGMPQRFPQTFILKKVIRNSKRIFNHAEKFLDRRIWPLPESRRMLRFKEFNFGPTLFMRLFNRRTYPCRKKKLVTIGHDFDGEQTDVEYSEGERIARLIEVLESLLKEGYSKGDIAVLCLTEPLEGNELKQLQEFTLTVNAERNDDDNIVLSTVREYGGLERPVVIIVDEPFNSSGEMWLNRVNYCAVTRGMVKLITLKKKSRGRKRKESN